MSGVKGKLYAGFPTFKCEKCAQCWNNECRAYKDPESQEEYVVRKSGITQCERDSEPRLVCPLYHEPMPRCEEHGCVLTSEGKCPMCEAEFEVQGREEGTFVSDVSPIVEIPRQLYLIQFKVPIDALSLVDPWLGQPYWCTGTSEDGTYQTFISYAPGEQYVLDNWPGAYDLKVKPVDGYVFTEKFPKPEWWKEPDA